MRPLLDHRSFSSFPDELSAGEVLVINDTRVIPARLYARPKGQMKNRLEFLLLRQVDALTWEAWCKPAKRVRAGDHVTFSDSLSARVLEKRDEGTIVIRFEGARRIDRVGIPLLCRRTPRMFARTGP